MVCVVECLRPGSAQPREGTRISPSASSEGEARERLARVLVCRECGQEITSPDHAFEVGGSHQHTFFNPVGILYEIGCFSQARGCANLGHPSVEFSWFPGFAWRYAHCDRCATHLGWRWESGGETFFGLILVHLAGA